MRHVPVLLKEVIEALQLKPGMNVIDCTLGDAGHSEKILEATKPNGRLLGIDADPESLLRAKQYLYPFGERAVFVRDNFENIRDIAIAAGFEKVHGILMDLGWSSPQFAERNRGFSFEKDEPLDMRFNPADGKLRTASEIVNTYEFDELYRMFRHYGEEDLSREVADAILEARKKEKIEKTSQLVEIILEVYRKKLGSTKEVPWIGGNHPATKVFQALRIEVNQELEVLKQALPQALDLLESGGRLAVITFHSLEDRIVKHFFKAQDSKKYREVTKKPVVPTDEEVVVNTRARSAKLRVIERMAS